MSEHRHCDLPGCGKTTADSFDTWIVVPSPPEEPLVFDRGVDRDFCSWEHLAVYAARRAIDGANVRGRSDGDVDAVAARLRAAVTAAANRIRERDRRGERVAAAVREAHR